jgi:hypothetical protein
MKWVNTDLNNAIRDNRNNLDKAEADIDKMMQTALATPEYVELLKSVGMNGDHLVLLKNEALAKARGQ